MNLVQCKQDGCQDFCTYLYLRNVYILSGLNNKLYLLFIQTNCTSYVLVLKWKKTTTTTTTTTTAAAAVAAAAAATTTTFPFLFSL